HGLPLGETLEAGDKLGIAYQIVAAESGHRAAPVGVRQVLLALEGAREQAAAEGAVADEAAPQLAQQREDLSLGVPAEQRVFALERGDRVGRVGSADGVGGGL